MSAGTMSDASSGDDVMDRVGRAIALIQSGDPSAARELLEQLWAEVGDDGDALHRCAIAHQLADVQDDLAEELQWDLRALAAATSISDERLASTGAATTVDGLFPSLHLNLADVYRRLGDDANARRHIEQGRRASGALASDGYGDMVRDALDRVERRLVEARSSSSQGPDPSADPLAP